MKPRPEKHTQTSQEELGRLDSSDMKLKKEHSSTISRPNLGHQIEMLNAIYRNHLKAFKAQGIRL